MNQSRDITAAPRPPGVVRRWLAAHPKFVDRGIAFCYLFGSALMALISWSFRAWFLELEPDATTLPVAWAILHEVATTAIVFAVLWRRRFSPLLGFIITAAVVLFQLPDPSFQILADSTALLFMMYAIPVYASVGKGWIALATATVVEFVKVSDWFRFNLVEGLVSLWVVSMLAHFAALLIGINVGNRRRYVDALIERAAMLERDREQLARISVAEERERIAREMHDIVAHSLSVMIALGEGAARTVSKSPEKAADAMKRSTETGRGALAEMRRLLGVLTDPENTDTADLTPQPDSTDLTALAEDVRGAGVRVTITSTGVPPDDPGLGLTVYRIVQESLTNVLRYAGPGTHANVELTYSSAETRVSVHDTGPVEGASTPLEEVGSGNGLAGLRERARMFGGSLTAGPDRHGGWTVEATLPVKETE